MPSDSCTVFPPISVGGMGMEGYEKEHKRSIENGDEYWKEAAMQTLTWERTFDHVVQGDLKDGSVAWFPGGKLNACYNAVDRHAQSKGDQVALIYEADKIGEGYTITYSVLLQRICKVANAMKHMGVRRGDIVTIYMPMIPEAVITVLACTRIGAPHNVVFVGFSAEALKDRILDAQSKWVFTIDEFTRGGALVNVKDIVDTAVSQCSCILNVFVFAIGSSTVKQKENDIMIDNLLLLMRPYCPCEPMDSEDTLFIIYTSGSTGAPKGLIHSTAGYLLHAAMTTRHVFDLREDDVFACMADIGWITGHSYSVYGPLVNGTTTLLFASTPIYPDNGRYWDVIQRHKCTQFYTAPTAIRMLMRYGTGNISEYDLSSLRVLGSVGEPINPEAWHWYYEHVGHSKITIVDTWWQTETGGHILTPLPGITPMKPGSCTLPFYGCEPAILDPQTGKELKGNNVQGVLALKRPWPGMARTILGDHKRYLAVYCEPYPNYYFTGDGCKRDEDGFYWITGRVDDVLNISGHRIGTAELESAISKHKHVNEAAVVGVHDKIKGQALCCFVTLKDSVTKYPDLGTEIRYEVKTRVGAFAVPKLIVITPGLCKTRSGKIMRRMLQKIAEGERKAFGDTTTLLDPSIIDTLVKCFNNQTFK